MATNFEGLVQVLKRNREQPTIEEESLAAGECPECMWPLKEREDGTKACPVCGVIYK